VFGTYRLALAVIVMAHHLLMIPVIGQYAVFSFFVLSGFLMTAVMAGTYGYGVGGFLRFAINRALRLYPAAFFAMALALLVIGLCGESFTQSYRAAMFLPRSPQAWAANLSMVFPRLTPYEFQPRLLPATWALTVELAFYVLIGLGLSRTRMRSSIWLSCSLIYTVTMIASGADYYDLYGFIPAGSLPFATGACVWHWREELRGLLDRFLPIRAELFMAGGMAWFLPFALIDKYTGIEAAKIAGLYLNIPLAAIVTIVLFNARRSNGIRRIDNLLGKYSYPVYLLHWPMGALASWSWLGKPVHGINGPSLVVFGLAFLLTLAASTAIILIVDPVVDSLRAMMKQSRGPDERRKVSLPVESRNAA
jgi:peptidoglycan/LPS O-acetylase OafA/YrhL